MILLVRLSRESALFAAQNVGTKNVTLSDIQINGISNSSSPAWGLIRGLPPGHMMLISLDLLKYFPEGIGGQEPSVHSYDFAFISTSGNVYYCNALYLWINKYYRAVVGSLYEGLAS